jgi:hypothetical protein
MTFTGVCGVYCSQPAINDFAPQNVPAVETIECHSCKCLHLIVLCGREDPFQWQPSRDKVRDPLRTSDGYSTCDERAVV